MTSNKDQKLLHNSTNSNKDLLMQEDDGYC